MSLESFDSILARVSGQEVKNPNANPLDSFKGPIKFSTTKNELKPVEYDVPTSAIYDRLSDGTYVAKFENYLGAVGNEDRLAKQQSALDQWTNGLLKNARKTGNYVLDATVGTVYGAINAIKEGSWEGYWNNDFSNKLDDWNKQLDYKLPNYYSDEQKSKGFLSSLGTANFWANDAAGALAFVGGALLPEIGLGFLTGGATFAGSAAKLSFKAGAKSFLKTAAKEGAEEILDPTNYMSKGKTFFGAPKTVVSTGKILDKAKDLEKFEGSVDLIKSLNKARYLTTAGSAVDTGLFLARTSGFEAGMEARHNFKDAVSTYLESFEEKNGRQPTDEEYSKFLQEATGAANGVFAANMAILSVSNAAMFGKAFNVKNPFASSMQNITKSTTNRLNKVIGLGLESGDEIGTLAVKEASRAQRFTGNIYKTLGKASVEGIYEEGMQGVAGKTMQNYLNAKYDPNNDSSLSLFSSFTQALSEQYGTKEGWKEMGIGMLIGWGVGSVQERGLGFIGKNSRKAAQASLQSKVEEVNRGVNTLRNMNRASSVRAFRNQIEQGIENGSDTSINDSMMDVEFIKSQSHLKTSGQIKEDYNAIIDHMQLDAAALDLLGDNVNAYKSNLKEQFSRNLENYQKAKATVEALNVGRNLKMPIGNTIEVEDALITSLHTGQSALSNARKLASEIETMVGSTGLFDHMEFVNSLKASQKTLLSDLKNKEKRLNDLRERAVSYGMQASQVQVEGKRNLKPETARRRQQMTAEKLVLVQQQITQLEKEKEQIEQTLGADYKTSTVNPTESIFQTTPDVMGAISEIDKLEDYVAALRRNGRSFDADSIEDMVERFKKYSDFHRETSNLVRDIASTDFFSTKKGKGLLNMIIGTPYEMTSELRKAIKENNKFMDIALKVPGIRGQEAIDLEIESKLKNSDQLSEREKHKIDTLLRMLLNVEQLNKEVKEATETVIELNSQVEQSNDPLEGDTVRLKESLNIKAEDLDNVEAIDKAIASILNQVEYLRGDVATSRKVTSINEKIKELKAKKNAIEEKQKQEQEGREPGDSVQPQGIVERQQEEGEGKGIERETTQQKADDSNSDQSSQEIDDRIAELEKELTTAVENLKIIDSPEYVRLNELLIKDEEEGLSEAEQAEKDTLEDEIDQWLFVTGTVAEGLRLSDLLRQKAMLESIDVEEVQVVANQTSQEIIEGVDFGDKVGRVHYDKAQIYDSVTVARNKKGLIEISGISPEDFIDELGMDIPFEVQEETNNILLNDKEDPTLLTRINNATNLSILPTNKNLTTNYSFIEKHTETTSEPLKSPFAQDFAEHMDVNAAYNTQEKEKLSLEVDPNDPYNKRILAETPQDLVIERLQKEGVIRLRNKEGAFCGVLKQKRKAGGRTKEDEKFTTLRDQVFGDPSTLDDMLSGKVIDTGLEVTVTKIFLGHPNYNMVKTEDNSVAIESRSFTDQDVKKVKDIGFVENGGYKTRSGVKGLDTTFLQKYIDRADKSRVAFVVIQVGKKRVAYPVKVNETEKTDHQEFKDIFKSNATETDKVIALNRYMASKGIDIKKPGDSFVIIGGSNLNTEFFNKKLAQLNSISYFYNLDSWLDGKVNIKDILKEQATIDINLSRPFHSPKIQFNLKDLEVEVSGAKSEPLTKPQMDEMMAKYQEARDAELKAEEERNKNC